MLVGFFGLNLCWAQAPGDGDALCSTSNPQVYPDTERNLMDSYNYENLLPGNGTGNPPIATAVWNDFSFDGNDANSTTTPTYVSVQLCFGVSCNIINIPVAARCWRNMSTLSNCLWMETEWCCSCSR